jgi:hypothetical protein
VQKPVNINNKNSSSLVLLVTIFSNQFREFLSLWFLLLFVFYLLVSHEIHIWFCESVFFLRLKNNKAREWEERKGLQLGNNDILNWECVEFESVWIDNKQCRDVLTNLNQELRSISEQHHKIMKLINLLMFLFCFRCFFFLELVVSVSLKNTRNWTITYKSVDFWKIQSLRRIWSKMFLKSFSLIKCPKINSRKRWYKWKWNVQREKRGSNKSQCLRMN